MNYSLRTSFQQTDDDNNIIGRFNLSSCIDTTGYFDNGLTLYKSILISLIQSLEEYEEGEFYGR